MRKGARLIACGLVALASSAVAKDYGQLGTTFPIEEVDLLKAISARLHGMQANGDLARAQQALKDRTIAGVMRPHPVDGLTPASEARTFTYDPSIEFDHDVRDRQGHLIVARGARFNPLKMLPFNETFVFFDGDRKAEMDFVLARFLGRPDVKLIMTKGAPFAAMKAWHQRFYFDQGGLLTIKLGVRHTPTTVARDGDVLRLNEIVLKGAS